MLGNLGELSSFTFGGLSTWEAILNSRQIMDCPHAIKLLTSTVETENQCNEIGSESACIGNVVFSDVVADPGGRGGHAPPPAL